MNDWELIIVLCCIGALIGVILEAVEADGKDKDVT